MWDEGGPSSSGASNSLALKYAEITKHHDAVFNDLMRECKHSAPGARLSARLRTSLERMCPAERRTVVCRTAEGCAPLFVACKRGNVEIVEYLVHVCCAELEQRGVYEVPDDRSVHSVTPLWCAAVEGRLEALRVLAEAGADVDACSDSGSTPVRSACFMTHLDVVRFLVARGADLHRPNHNGGTCLINSVQSVRLCTFLLERGAKVDAQDMQKKTALHYAIQEHRVETARLLLDHGADPHLASRAGDDALRTACLKGAAQVVALLASRVRYSPERLADAYELLGATQLDEFNDVAAALAAWRRATALRHPPGGEYIPKRGAVCPGAERALHGAREWRTLEELEQHALDMDALRTQALLVCARVLGPAHKDQLTRLMYRGPTHLLTGAREWRTLDELEQHALDMDALRTQALLVCARVLGPAHKDQLTRLMYRGASYGDAFRYQQCIDLWTWALDIRIQKDSLLYTDTCHTACALTRLMLDARAGRLERARGLPRHEDVMAVFGLMAANLPECRRALEVRPVHRKQAETFDRALRCVTHLLHLALRTATPEQLPGVQAAARELVAADVRSAHTGDTLLHLSVSCLNVIRSTYFADELAAVPPIFPSVEVVGLLLSAGARVDARNGARSTALHVAAAPYNFSSDLVEALLAAGAHLDQPNRFGDRPADLVPLHKASRVRVLRHVTLACLAARAVVAARIHVPKDLLPATLHDFLDLHRP